jgi:uncharacterized protein YegL
MPNTNLTAIAVVLDRSGSMQGLEEATIAGLNQFLRGQRAAEGQAVLTLVQFDDQYEVNRDFADLKDVPDLTQADYQPRGSTALLDAIGRTITDMGNKLAAMPEATRPGKVVFVIQTDGFENASREFNHARIQDMIAHQRTKYAWDFVFLGANQDAIASGAMLGIAATSSLSYNSNKGSTMKTFQMVNASVGASRRSGAGGQSVFSASSRAYAADDSINYSEALDNLQSTDDAALNVAVTTGTTPPDQGSGNGT